jgi:erythronate-4-phosphate dehydrogenase
MLTLIIDEHIPFIKGILEPFARIIYARGGQIDRKMARIADGLIIRTRTSCDATLLDGTPVKFIATATIGYDHIDTEYCNQKGISWHHAPGCNASSVKQYIASVMANLILKHDYDLEGRKIGVVGVGHVGSKVARLARILGMAPLLNDPPRERQEAGGRFVSLEEIQETCDIITFHVPLIPGGSDKTFHIAGKNFFERLGKRPVVINTSRGAVNDTKSVKKAIRHGLISAYIADVWENEPDPDPELLEMAKIATPHIAGYSLEGKANGTAACVRAASDFFGFGLGNWYPPLLPPPLNELIQPDTRELADEQLVAEAILATYDVMNDDIPFRNDPVQFEDLRNFYPVRREFEAFKIKLNNSNPDLFAILQSLGFKVTINDF